MLLPQQWQLECEKLNCSEKDDNEKFQNTRTEKG